MDVNAIEMLERALDYLKRRGRKRVAAMDVPGMAWLRPETAIPMASRRGLKIEPYWLLGINHMTHETASTTVQLLMSTPARQRPDALIVANPFLVESATAGLVAAGVRVPQDVEVIAGGNFPHLTRAHVPVKWIGVDIREMVRAAVEIIDRQRRGEHVPERFAAKNIFENELPASDPLMKLVEA
jgi:DNA-binding LacI/PurR family transcriptional regulator